MKPYLLRIGAIRPIAQGKYEFATLNDTPTMEEFGAATVASESEACHERKTRMTEVRRETTDDA